MACQKFLQPIFSCCPTFCICVFCTNTAFTIFLSRTSSSASHAWHTVYTCVRVTPFLAFLTWCNHNTGPGHYGTINLAVRKSTWFLRTKRASIVVFIMHYLLVHAHRAPCAHLELATVTVATAQAPFVGILVEAVITCAVHAIRHVQTSLLQCPKVP